MISMIFGSIDPDCHNFTINKPFTLRISDEPRKNERTITSFIVHNLIYLRDVGLPLVEILVC